MSNTIPLPEPAYPAGTTGMLGENAWDRHQMHAHAAAVTAADNAALRAELEEWRFTNKVDELDRHVTRQNARIKVLEAALRGMERELQSCQAVIHLAGGFDPAYVRDAQAALKAARAALGDKNG